MGRGRRACKVVNFCEKSAGEYMYTKGCDGLTITLYRKGLDDVVTNELKVWMTNPMVDGGL